MNFQLILKKMVSPCTWITFGTNYLNKLIYIPFTLANLVLNMLQSLLNFYFWFLTVIHIVRVSLIQSERSAIMVAITCDQKMLATQHKLQGHTSCIYINAFAETISIRNNLLGILIPKINIFGKKLAFSEWEPIKCILTQVKSTTHKNLQVRKNKNSKQQLMREDPEDWTFIIIFVNSLTWSKYCVIIVFIIYFWSYKWSPSMIFKPCMLCRKMDWLGRPIFGTFHDLLPHCNHLTTWHSEYVALCPHSLD